LPAGGELSTGCGAWHLAALVAIAWLMASMALLLLLMPS